MEWSLPGVARGEKLPAYKGGKGALQGTPGQHETAPPYFYSSSDPPTYHVILEIWKQMNARRIFERTECFHQPFLRLLVSQKLLEEEK